ncbi:MAG: peroxiredoxin-like family protein [Spirochaetota bacterium]
MSEKPGLTQELEELKTNFSKKASQEKKDAYETGIKEVAESGILSKALKKGDTAKDFTLKNALGKEISLYEELKEGPVLLVWYRGGWCPYCNLTLHHLQKKLPEFQKYNANLIAITPELPDKSLSTKEKHKLQFQVVSDVGNKVAKDYGIVFKVNAEVSKYYKEKFNLQEYNGDASDELPLAATYIIEKSGKITYAFLDADYRKRADPEELLSVLRSMQ